LIGRLAVSAVVVIGAFVAAPDAASHQNGCHSAHSCPSDHHTYVWSNPSTGQLLNCVAPGAPEYDAALDTTLIVWDGRPYYCRVVGAPPLPPPAVLRPPTILSVSHRDRRPVVTWSLQPGTRSEVIEVATSPELDASGRFLGNLRMFSVLLPEQTRWTTWETLAPGWYYVRVAANDAVCLTCPVWQWSPVVAFEIKAPLRPAQVPLSVRFGRGIGTWRIGMSHRTAPGLTRSERHPERDGPGCTGVPQLASRIDYYPGLRLSWDFWREGARRRSALTEVATTRGGARSDEGFVIGKARFADVRARHRRAQVWGGSGRYKLGARVLLRYRKTGYESGLRMEYWFGRSGVLTAIATGASGC
jgi:hypothetical protein